LRHDFCQEVFDAPRVSATQPHEAAKNLYADEAIGKKSGQRFKRIETLPYV
jgi:hypothetical protein